MTQMLQNTSVRAPGLSTDEREHPFVWYFGAGWNYAWLWPAFRKSQELIYNSKVAIPAAIYRSAPGPGPESAPRSGFWAILGPCLEVPQKSAFRVLFGVFWAQETPKSTREALFWGTPRQGPKIAQKALRGALSGPGRESLLYMAAGIVISFIIIRGVPWQGGTGLDTYQICIQACFDTYQIPSLISKLQRKTLKTCTERGVALDARART